MKWLWLLVVVLVGWFVIDWPMYAPWIPERWQFPLTCVWTPIEVVGLIWLTVRKVKHEPTPEHSVKVSRLRYW